MPKKTFFEDNILLETTDYIFWNKPANVASLKERGDSKADNVLSLAKNYTHTAILCHRLDKQTSGVILIAKNIEAHRHASIQFQKKLTAKVYHAFAKGKTFLENHIVDLPILIDEKRRAVRIDKQLGKKSITHFTTIKNYTDYSLIACNIKTGRMHQIRIHLSVLGHPICGDTLYGGEDIFLSSIKRKYQLNKTKEEKPLIKRFALHAFELCINDINGNWICVNAKYPKDFEVLKKQLDKLASLD